MNLNKLNAKFVELGISKEDFAREEFGITLQALNKKLNGSTKITVDDALVFCRGLQITDDRDKCEIFLT